MEMSDKLQDVLLQNDSILDAELTLAGVSLFCWPLEVAGSSAGAPDDSCSSALGFCFLGSDLKKEAMPLFGAMLLCYWRLLLWVHESYQSAVEGTRTGKIKFRA